MNADDPDVKIELRDLWKVFGPDPDRAIDVARTGTSQEDIHDRTGATVAVRGVEFAVRAGEIFVVMGLSGSGKSTLVRCINRLIEPSQGTVLVDGEDVTGLRDKELRELRRQKLGMVFQRFALLPHRTVLANVEYGLEVQGIARAEREERARAAIGVVGLDGWEDSYPDQLSGGMRQRVGLARALAPEPDVLLMDEPFSALDPLIRRDMQDELIDLQARLNKTIVFITHDLDEALKLADRMAIMKAGAVVQIGTPQEILRHPEDEYVRAFVEDVVAARVLTAGDVMFRPRDLVRGGHSPEVALRMMERQGVSSAFVVDGPDRLLGLVTADATVDARRDPNIERVDQLTLIDAETTTVDTPLRELIPTAVRQPYPLAVVDDEGGLDGIVLRVSILRGLAGEDVGDETEGSVRSDPVRAVPGMATPLPDASGPGDRAQRG